MMCRKCGTKMHGEASMSRSSNLHSHAGTLGKVEGFKCWCCGTWIELDVAPMVYDKSDDFENIHRNRYKKVEKCVSDNLQQIIEMRKSGMIYRRIIEALSLPISESALQRYYSQSVRF